jgi:hypothetical protein
VAWQEVVIAGRSEALEELILEGEEKSARQNAEIGVPFLPLPSSGGRHESE